MKITNPKLRYNGSYSIIRKHYKVLFGLYTWILFEINCITNRKGEFEAAKPDKKIHLLFLNLKPFIGLTKILIHKNLAQE